MDIINKMRCDIDKEVVEAVEHCDYKLL